jgi:hypothetical protein
MAIFYQMLGFTGTIFLAVLAAAVDVWLLSIEVQRSISSMPGSSSDGCLLATDANGHRDPRVFSTRADPTQARH